MMSLYCFRCGEKLPDNALFCLRCGTKLKLPRCPSCGLEAFEGMAFCRGCGTPLKAERSSSAGETPAKRETSAQETAAAKEPAPASAVIQEADEPAPAPAAPAARQAATSPAPTPAPQVPFLQSAPKSAAPKQQSAARREAVNEEEEKQRRKELERKQLIQRRRQRIGSNAEYYLRQFGMIDACETPRFNWSAFFFTFAFCFYRRMAWLAVKYFSVPFVLTLAAVPFFVMGAISLNFTAIVISLVLLAAGNIWYFVNSIRLGLRFNSEYYSHIREDEALEYGSERSSKDGVSAAAAVLGTAAVTATYVVLAFVSALLGGYLLSIQQTGYMAALMLWLPL